MNETRQRKENLQAIFRDRKYPATDVCCRLLREDVPLDWNMACDAVEVILHLRDQNENLSTAIDSCEAQIEEIRNEVEMLRAMLPEEVTDV